MDERGFAGAGDAGDADEQVEGDFDVDAAQVVDARAGEEELFAAGLAAVLGDGDVSAAGEIFAGDGVGVVAETSSTVPAARSWPPSSPAPGPRSSR